MENMIKKINSIVGSKLFEYLLLSIILVLGFCVRLYKINNPIADWHSWRQADTASVTRNFVENGIDVLHPTYHDISSIQTGIFNPKGYRFVEFPVYNIIHAGIYKTFPQLSLEIWGRLVSVISAVLSSLFLYLIGKRIINKWGGLLSAFFYSFIPFNIYFTRVILPEPLSVTFAVISIWLFIKFIDDDSDLSLYFSGVFMSLAMLVKPFFGFYLIPMSYIAINKFGFKKIFADKKLLTKTFVFLILTMMPLIIWRAWVSKYPEGVPFFAWAFNGDMIRFRPAFWYWIFGERLGHLILGSLGLIPFVFGILNTKTKNLFIQFFLLGMFAYVTVVATASVRHDYYQIITIPAIALALASGSVYLWSKSEFNRLGTRILLAFAVFVMLVTGFSQIKPNYAVNHPEIMEAGHAVDTLTPKDSLVVAPYNGDTAFLYQTHRWGWPAIDDSIDHIIEKGADYYVSVDLGSPDTKMIEARFKTIKKTNNYILVDLNNPLKK